MAREPPVTMAEEEAVAMFEESLKASDWDEVPMKRRTTSFAAVVVACTMVVAPSPVTSLLLKSAAAVHVFEVVAAAENGR